ncbi:MAG: site-specific integrase [Gordonia sp. (in: high G+C Gram-positive bacteria)]|uniref:tyrosine-type recombinase/integrase n=1 Tax=Gordonia sp. (in: high G+C Gram-positive bacteria) TaxID=84139 RepID=UPI0039E30C8A
MAIQKRKLTNGQIHYRARVYDPTTKKLVSKQFRLLRDAEMWERSERLKRSGTAPELKPIGPYGGFTELFDTTDSHLTDKGGKKHFFKLVNFLEEWELEASRESTKALRVNLRKNAGALGEIGLRQIDVKDVLDWQHDLRVASPCSGKKLAEPTIAVMSRLLRSAFTVAVDRGYMDENPMSTLKSKRMTNRQVSRHEIPKKSEIDLMVEKAETVSDDLAMMIRMAASTGLRIQELSGLRLRSVDVDRRRIHVAEQGTGSKEWKWGPLKSDSCDREVPVPASLMTDLQAFVKDKDRKMYEPLFQTGSGLMWTASNAGRMLRVHVREPLKKKLSGEWTFHSFRHYYASVLIGRSVDVATVSRLLGHSSYGITFEVYTHVLPGALDRAEAAVEAALTAE